MNSLYTDTRLINSPLLVQTKNIYISILNFVKEIRKIHPRHQQDSYLINIRTTLNKKWNLVQDLHLHNRCVGQARKV